MLNFKPYQFFKTFVLEFNSVADDWWRTHISKEDLTSPNSSYKLQVMFEILKYCRRHNEKCLIFSSFTVVLNMVEHFLQFSTKYGMAESFIKGRHYYRFDGSTSKTERHKLITKFNDSANKEVVCFLISARAGGQGINLTGANRVIILVSRVNIVIRKHPNTDIVFLQDTSWNPSNDQQNIFRVYRLGQKRPCYIYRLLAMGTMEEKVYSRAVTKQAMAFRVVRIHRLKTKCHTNCL